MKEQGGEKDLDYEYIFALSYSASVRKYGVEIRNFSKDKTFAEVTFSTISLLFGVLVGKIFLWGPAQ